MCKKLIICMGNSYKNGGRCLAGIEVKKTSNGYSVVKDNAGSPKWIRPVMANDHHGIPESMVKAFGMLDVLEVNISNEVPVGAHSENVHFCNINKVGRYNGSLLSLCDEGHSLIFGNRGKAVSEEVFSTGGYSLMFVKPTDLFIESLQNDYGHEKYRIRFTYMGNRYDFPLTDPEYIALLQRGQRECGNRKDELYLTLSLGVNFNDWHYKLVAGVVEKHQNNVYNGKRNIIHSWSF